MQSVAGQWIQVKTDHLFPTAFNAIVNGECYHVDAALVSEVEDDARVGYPWVHVGANGITCYTQGALEQMVRDGLMTKVLVEYMSFADNKIHETKIIVPNNFTFGDIHMGVLNSDRSQTEYQADTVSPAIDKIILDF